MHFGKTLYLSSLLVVSTQALAAGIAIDSENPRYWSFDGARTILLGGSNDDNLFQNDDVEAQLDRLAKAGGNYVRNTMSSRDGGNLWPHRQGFARDGRPIESLSGFERFIDKVKSWSDSGDGVYPKYDLGQFDPQYWDKFDALLRLARNRNIVVQVELWDRFDYARGPWHRNPFNPQNNINYSTNQSGLKLAYPEHPGRNRNSFFRTVPALLNNELLLSYQRAWVDQLLAISLRYDNVLYTISNETSGDEPWSTYWAEYLRRQAEQAGVTVYITEMWDAHNLADPIHRRTLAYPERYDFIEVSQNNHQIGQTHWDKLLQQRQRLTVEPRPMNNVKIYGADGGRFNSTDEAIDRFWRALLGGSAAVRFHRPEQAFGLGLRAQAQQQIRSASALLAVVDLSELEPQTALLEHRSENEAYASALVGERYVVYFPRGGDVLLPLPADLNFNLAWLQVDSTQWQRDTSFQRVGGGVQLVAPNDGRWVAVIDLQRPTAP